MAAATPVSTDAATTEVPAVPPKPSNGDATMKFRVVHDGHQHQQHQLHHQSQSLTSTDADGDDEYFDDDDDELDDYHQLITNKSGKWDSLKSVPDPLRPINIRLMN